MNRLLLASIAAVSLALQPAAAAAQALARIGAAGGVRGTPMRKSTNEAVAQVIGSGKPVYLNDHVTTDASSRLQVLLNDETVFTLGPNGDMVLDEFVYDPSSQAGKVTASVTRGVFRFVTGNIAKTNPSSMKVKLPVGTIGIRGTIVAGIVTPGMSAAMLAGPGAGNDMNAKTGAFELSNGAGSTFVGVSGEGSMITGALSAPTPAGPLPASVLGDINAGLTAAPAPSEGGGSESGSELASGDTPVSETSGQATAAGNASSNETSGATEVDQALTATSVQGSQDQIKTSAGVADGLSTWDQFREFLTGGTGFYFSNHVAINCPNCLGSPAPEGALQLYYDFANKCIGGTSSAIGPSGQSGSFVHLHNVYSSGDTVQSTISLIEYGLSSFTGSASLQLNPYLGTVTGGGGSFNGSTLKFENVGGVVGKQAVVDLQFSNSSPARTATGTIVAPR